MVSHTPEGWPTSASELSARIYATLEPTLEILEMMLMLEAAGKPLYEQLADAVANPEAAQLILKNAREELAHAHRLRKAIEMLDGRILAVPPADVNPYAERRDFSTADANTLRSLAQSERRGEAHYESWAQATSHPEVARLLRLNGAEERRHAERLEMAARLLDPRAQG